MKNKSMDAEQSTWYSSYGLVTVGRIFDLMGIHFNQTELLQVSHSQNSPYYQLLQTPLKNIFNGIILDQATDFREYVQKMLVDYLLSGAADLSEDQTKPEGAKLVLDDMRLDVIASGDQFDLLQFEHHKLIANTQNAMIELVRELPDPPQILNDSFNHALVEVVAPYLEQAESITYQAKEYRTKFYNMIFRARETLDTIPEYFNTLDTQPEHIEALYFDANFGEEV